MGLFKADPPPPPDYGPLIQASAAATTQATALAKEQFAWAKNAYASDKTISDQVTSAFLNNMNTQSQNAAEDRARYKATFQPLEDSLVSDAQSYASPERKAQEMGRAQAGVAQQFDAKRQAAQTELEGFGINPSSTRFAALDIGMRANQGAAEAGAADAASRAVDDRAIALRDSAINIGKGYPAQSTAEIASSGNAGSGAAGTALNTTASGASSMGTAPGYFNQATAGIGQQGALMGQNYANQVAYTNAQNAANPLSGILGTVAGIGAKAFGLNSGGAIPNPSFGYSPGGAVDPKTSPSGGAIPDDVSARLTPGEFVIPTDTVRWLGEKHFHSMIDKSRQDRQAMGNQSGAQPKPMQAIPHPAAFQSRPMSALPVR